MEKYLPILIFLTIILLGIVVIQYSEDLKIEEQEEPEYTPSFLQQQTCETKDQCKIGFVCKENKCTPRPPINGGEGF